MKIKPFNLDVQVPVYATSGSAGADIFLPVDWEIHPGETVTIPCRFALEIPPGFEVQLRVRSSIGKKGLIMPNAPATIDSDYRGEVHVMLHNIHNFPIRLKRGDRIAQMILAPVFQAQFLVVQDLNPSIRGEGGFGSTGR